MSHERAATEIDSFVGAAIRARRLAIGLSQEALAGALGVTFQQVQKYEKGVNRVAASRLYDIAAALACAVSDLMPADRETARPDDAALALMSTASGAKLAALFVKANPKERAALLQAARAIIE